jgi:hypothetical protein
MQPRIMPGVRNVQEQTTSAEAGERRKIPISEIRTTPEEQLVRQKVRSIMARVKNVPPTEQGI